MKIEIKSDVFNIVKRVKEIDEGYYILFDLSKNVFELHYRFQPNSYCFSFNYESLDNRLIDNVYASIISNIDNIIEDIDNNNVKLECENLNNIKDYAGCVSRDIYEYCSNTSKDYNSNNAFLTVWR